MNGSKPLVSRSLWLWATVVFVAAFLPRLYALGTFLTIDEVKWAKGAAQFLLALHSGDLTQTYWHFFPGITISWGSALALWGLCTPTPNLAACANTQVENLAQSIGWLRLSTVLLNSLGIGGVYLLGSKLTGHRLALLTALLLAFDPFFIAHSRILNGDAGAAILMFLSLLSFLIYWLDRPASQRQWRFLLLSGAMAGLALLTKLPAPLIGLFAGGLGLVAMALDWRTHKAAVLRQWLVALVVWGGLALLVFTALWPALWVAPIETLQRMYVDAFEVGGAGEGHDTFFLGETSADPGPWFYPYVIAFRLTPVTMVGLLLTAFWLLLPLAYFVLRTSHVLLRHFPAKFIQVVSNIALHSSRATLQISGLAFPNSRVVIITLVMLVYVAFIIFFSNLSPKKLDRYVMAVIPAIVLLAAAGYDYLIDLAQALSQKTGRSGSGRTGYYFYPALIAVIAIQLLSAVAAAPYYLTYYNPWLGGVERVVRQAPVGWGEGLEQAADYLNNLPEAKSLRVSSWYSDIFQPYFVGERASFADDGRAQLAADYVVFYVNQIQRQKPYPGLVDYFRDQKPVFTVEVEQVPWVEVYQAPAAQSASGAPKIEGIAQLLAYQVTGSPEAEGRNELLAGDEVAVTLFLRVLGPLPDDALFDVALTSNTEGEATDLWGNWQSTGLNGIWQEGNIVEWHGVLTLAADTPPGAYRLWVALQQASGLTIGELLISEKDPAINVD